MRRADFSSSTSTQEKILFDKEPTEPALKCDGRRDGVCWSSGSEMLISASWLSQVAMERSADSVGSATHMLSLVTCACSSSFVLIPGIAMVRWSSLFCQCACCAPAARIQRKPFSRRPSSCFISVKSLLLLLALPSFKSESIFACSRRSSSYLV